MVTRSREVASVTGHLLTARAVAEQLDVSVETVLRWARRGELPAVYLSSRAIRFREEELERWLEEGRRRDRRRQPSRPAPPAN